MFDPARDFLVALGTGSKQGQYLYGQQAKANREARCLGARPPMGGIEQALDFIGRLDLVNGIFRVDDGRTSGS